MGVYIFYIFITIKLFQWENYHEILNSEFEFMTKKWIIIKSP